VVGLKFGCVKDDIHAIYFVFSVQTTKYVKQMNNDLNTKILGNFTPAEYGEWGKGIKLQGFVLHTYIHEI